MTSVTDLLIRKIDPKLKRELEKRARANGRSLSDEAKTVLDKAINKGGSPKEMGTLMFNLLPAEYRGDDLVFEVPGEIGEPPDFE
jgi:plasmid stability protein